MPAVSEMPVFLPLELQKLWIRKRKMSAFWRY